MMLLAEQTGNNKILYLYDGTGLIGFKRNGVTYTYVYNGLGDVMEILDKDGNSVLVCQVMGSVCCCYFSVDKQRRHREPSEPSRTRERLFSLCSKATDQLRLIKEGLSDYLCKGLIAYGGDFVPFDILSYR